MFDIVDEPTATTASIDQLENELATWEAVVAHARARQAALLLRLDTAQVAAVDGARNLLEWTAGRLDIETDTAKVLVATAKGLAEHPEMAQRVADEEMSFDRAAATVKLITAGASAETVETSFGFDLAGVAKITARHRRLTRTTERRGHTGRFWASQHSLDHGNARFWGELPGADMELVEKALHERADALPPVPDGCPDRHPQRMADALVAISVDTIDAPTDGDTGAAQRQPLATVFIDADLAAATSGEAGAELTFGPRVGPDMLDQILCSGAVQVIGISNGRPVAVTDGTQAIPPAIRRYITWRDGGCTIDGCTSRHRLQPHHIKHRRHGGDNHPDNLTTLCWYHHHVIIHRHGYRLDPATPPGRRRFLRNHHDGPAPPVAA